MEKEVEIYRKYPGFKQAQTKTDAEKHLENLAIKGYSIMPNVISASEAQNIGRKLTTLWEKQTAEFGKDRLMELGEYGTHRGLLVEDQVFRDMVMQPRVLEVVHAVLGKSAILNLQNASAAFPGLKHFQTSFHRDFAKDFVTTKPLSINAFWCITDFSVETGATQAVAGTHKLEDFPSHEFIMDNCIDLCAPAGSILFWDSLLLHRTGFNTSPNVRFGINHMYTRPFLKQQIDFPVFLKGMVDPESPLGQMLGFWTIPPKSVKEFRVDPSKRTYRQNQG